MFSLRLLGEGGSGLPVLTLPPQRVALLLLWSNSSSPAVPCTHNSFQQKKRDSFLPWSIFKKKQTRFWEVLHLSLVRTRCVPPLVHWDYPDYLCIVWIYSWEGIASPSINTWLYRGGCQERKRILLSRQRKNIQNTHIFLFYLLSQNTIEMSYLCISTPIYQKKWKQS